jgi:hypothetical protein
MIQSVRRKLHREASRGRHRWPARGMALLLWILLTISSPIGARLAQGEDRSLSSFRPSYSRWLFEVEQELRILSESSASPMEVVERLRRLRSSSTLEQLAQGEFPQQTRWLEREIESLLPSTSDDIEQRRSKLLEVANRITRLRGMLEEVPLLSRREDDGAEEVAAQARLKSILTRTELLPPPSEEQESLQQAWASVQVWWGDILENLIGEPVDPPGQAVAGEPRRGGSQFLLLRGLLVLGVGLILLLSGWRLRAIVRERRRSSTTHRPTASPTPETLGELLVEGVGESALLTQATTLASQGDYRSAIRSLYLATLTHLTEQGLLALRPTWSNRDCVQALRNEERLLPLLVRLIAKYEESWYGGQAPPNTTYEAFRSGYEEVLLATAHRRTRGQQTLEPKR